MRNAFIRSLNEVARHDGRVMLLTGDLGYKLFDDFACNYPGRFINAGVAEANMAGVAAGLALGGMRPFIYSIVPFVTLRCLEQIRNDICYHNAPVTIVGVGGGYAYGPNGPTHHALEDIAIMRALPNMTVVCPGDPIEVELCMQNSVLHHGPLYIRLGRAGDSIVHRQPPTFQIGRAIFVREGRDCAVLSTGGMLPVAVAVSDLLLEQGFHCDVVSMHTVKPLDTGVLQACCARKKSIFTIEEHSRMGGLGSAVAEYLASAGLPGPVKMFGVEDRFAHVSGSQAYLRHEQGLSAEQIAECVLGFLRDAR